MRKLPILRALAFVAALSVAPPGAFGAPGAVGAQTLLDGDHLLPVDHAWGLPHLPQLQAAYSADTFPLLGVSYRGYIVFDLYLPEGELLIYSAKDLLIGQDGYRYVDSGLDPSLEPLLLLAGGDVAIPLSRAVYERAERFLSGDGRGCQYFSGGPERMYEFLKKVFATFTSYDGSWREGSPGVWDDGIESITAWSRLTETVKGKTLSYDESRLRHPFYSYMDSDLNFNNGSLFWAEGEAGPGLGGVVEIRFSRPADHLMVLNGAVDVTRRHLYKDNNRLKRVVVSALDGSFSLEHTFEDFVAFHRIPFPAETRAVSLSIVEVYPGRRWDDTCVSALFLKQQQLRSRAELQAEVDRYVALRWVDRRIIEYERRARR